MTIDWWAVSGWVMTASSFALSVGALFVADSAKKAVAKVLSKGNEQENRDDARDLLTKLNKGKDAAMARRGGAKPLLAKGRSLPDDMLSLATAQDSCATANLPGDPDLTTALKMASTQLIEAIDAINGQGDRDGWADAQAALQGVVPRVNSYQSKLGTKALQGD